MEQHSKELSAYVKDHDSLNFLTFTNEHKAKIAECSVDTTLTHKNAIQLHSYWKRCFARNVREHGKKMTTAPRRTYDKVMWESILTMARKLDQAKTTYQTEAIDALIAAAPSSSTMLKNVFDTHDKSLQQDDQPQDEQQQEDAMSSRPEWENLDLEGRLHFLAYKKISGRTFDAVEKQVLISITNDGSVKSCLMYLAAQHLLLDTMTDDDMMCLKLLLSRVVNISNPTFKNLMAKYLEPDVLQSFEQALPIPFELDLTISDFISQVEAKEDDVDAILELVCEQKLKYLQHKTSDMYACICCVEHM
ncbi:hypothetical protein AB4K20DRAFT_1969875 [Rhizopus microsporus]|uniref:Uncharacterized protein n=1 Tax=Rhizopus microsporus TaxID=58291 RepID=A0A1X0S844_RHIZD|nr:hypothetical protein BCV71DRAFT_280633 [Rhizopus microsporus]